MKKICLAAVWLFLISLSAFTQTKINGIVTDENNNPLNNVEISVKGTSLKTYSSQSGEFSIEVPENSKYLVLKHPNFSTIETEILSSKLTVKMKRLDISIFDLSLEELLNIEVVSSSKSEQNIRFAPNIITVTPHQKINDFAYESINDVLYHQAGFYPGQDYERKVVGSRGNFEGWNNNHLYLLVDGVPFNDNLYGTAYTWEITPLVFTKNLEIIKGPGAALYGSNATNGVITMNTFSADDFDIQKAFVSFSYGSFNTKRFDFVSASKFKNFDAVYSFSNFSTDGFEYQSYDGSYEKDLSGNIKKMNINDNRQSNYIFVKLNAQNKLDGLSFQFHKQMWSFQTGHGWLWHISDFKEPMFEDRDIFVVKYNKKMNKLRHEYLIRYQNHSIDWKINYYRAGTFNNFYPSGAIEYLKTNAQDVFVRLQTIYNLKKNAFIVFGIEPDMFFYNGDKEHYANFDINNENNNNYEPNPLGKFYKVGYWFEPIYQRPVTNIGSFVHFDFGEIISNYFKMTAGIRYDYQFFDYVKKNISDIPITRTFRQFSPRLAFIILPAEVFNIKLMAGTAFRAPTPTEMFGSNTWTLASNIENLKPEIVKTAELAIDYMITKKINLKINTFYLIYENQIAYSIANYNLSTNIFNTSNIGVEGEILYNFGDIQGYFNVSFYKRLDEKIFDPEKLYVSEHKNKITWAPYHTSNFGVVYKTKYLNFTLNGHFQSKVHRRDLDLYSNTELQNLGLPENVRTKDLNSFFLIDTKVDLKLNFIFLTFNIKNILNSEIYLCKNMKYPFDYLQPGRTYSVSLKCYL